jgi:Leucine-rich repeat (LRR) protein
MRPMRQHAWPLTIVCALPRCSQFAGTALIKLYEAFDGANWKNNRNWNVTSGTSAENKANDPCDPNKRWYGIGFIDPCEKYLDDIVGEGPQTDFLTRVLGAGQGCFAGRITSINLRRNNLRGNLTVPELGDLTNLTFLDLSWNSLHGAIPTEIGRINNVQLIHLEHNNVSGHLPTELGLINSMGPDASNGCGLDDPCPPGTQLKLTDLDLAYNQIDGPIPSELGSLVHLKVLDLGSNNLTESVPVELGMIRPLQVLDLRLNALTGPLPDGLLQNLTDLRYLYLQQNALTGGVPSEVGRLVKLSDLHMHGNQLDAALPDEIGDMTLLQDLRLQDNRIPGSIPDSIGNLLRLRYLDLYNNRMVGDVPASIANLTNLKELYLQNEHLTPVRNR